MGDKPPRTLLDYARLDADAAVRCGGCQRTVTVEARALAARFGPLGLVREAATLAPRLKCQGSPHDMCTGVR